MRPLKHVFLTGATGFLGFHILQRLIAVGGLSIAVLVRKAEDVRRLGSLERIVPIIGDMSAPGHFSADLNKFRPDAVINAAWTGVAKCERSTPEQINNISNSIALLDVAHQSGAQSWIGIGSQAEYGPQTAVITADTTPAPDGVYGTAKLCTFRVSQIMCRALGIRFAWLRLFSCYGPMDHADALLPYVIRALIRRQVPAISGAANVWDYLYVTDAAEAIYTVLHKSELAGAFNVASGQALTIRSVVEKVRDLIDPDLPIDVLPAGGPRQHMRACNGPLVDSSGWVPRVTLTDGLAQTVDFYRRQLNEIDGHQL